MLELLTDIRTCSGLADKLLPLTLLCLPGSQGWVLTIRSLPPADGFLLLWPSLVPDKVTEGRIFYLTRQPSNTELVKYPPKSRELIKWRRCEGAARDNLRCGIFSFFSFAKSWWQVTNCSGDSQDINNNLQVPPAAPPTLAINYLAQIFRSCCRKLFFTVPCSATYARSKYFRERKDRYYLTMLDHG